MARHIPTVQSSELHAQWFADQWAQLSHGYPTDDLRWDALFFFNPNMTIDRLKEVLRHNPPIVSAAKYFCSCAAPKNNDHHRAVVILEHYTTQLLAELNHPDRRAEYAKKTIGLNKDDPMLAWNVWSSHRSVWRKYLQYGGVLLDPHQDAAHLNIFLSQNCAPLVDVLPHAPLTLQQTKDLLNLVEKELERRKTFTFAEIWGDQLNRCALILIKKLPQSDRQTLIHGESTPASWTNTVQNSEKTIKNAPPKAQLPSLSPDEARALREKRLTRSVVEQILASGLNIEHINTKNQTLLQQVVEEKLISALPAVLAKTPNLHVRQSHLSNRPLCDRAVECDPRCLRLLLEAGANPWLYNDFHQNALHTAISRFKTEHIKILLHHPGFRPQDKTYAVKLGQVYPGVRDFDIKVVEMFNLLVAAGTDMSWHNSEYPSFVEYLAKNCLAYYPHLVTVLKNAMDDLRGYKQALAIEHHIAPKPKQNTQRKM